MSDIDIVISADDRLGSSRAATPRRTRRQAPAAEGVASAKAKPARKRRPPLLTPFQRAVAVGVVVIGVLVFALVMWHAGVPQRAFAAVVDDVLQVTARAGFRVEEITVTGRERTAAPEILTALAIRQGDPILGLDIEDAKDRLEAIPSVRAAAVERRLPRSLRVVIAERVPVALWQHDGAFVLIDDEGHQIPGSIDGFQTLPLVVGDGASVAAPDLLELMATEPALAKRVKSAVRVGSRRWDLRLDDAINGLEARLPEDGTEEAWHRLAKLEGEHGLSKRNVTMVDLRYGERLVLQTAHQNAATPELAGAHHKDNGG